MGTKDAEFLKRLLAMFKIEAAEHLNVISVELSRLERGQVENQAETVETMYREAHTLKGAARSVNLPEIVSLCQSIEGVFSALKLQEIAFSATVSNLLHQTVDFCYRLVEGKKSSTSEKAALNALIQQLDDSAIGEVAGEAGKYTAVKLEPGRPKNQELLLSKKPSAPDYPEPQPLAPASILAVSETIRISTAVLDTLLLKAEEMISLKLATGQRLADLRELKKAFDSWKKGRQRERFSGNSGRDYGADPLSTDSFVSSFDSRLTDIIRATDDDYRTSGAMIDMLLDDMKKTLMLPFSSMLGVFPRLVRDLACTVGKQVEFTLEGGEIEIDRRVLEEIKDPLLHLVRNCLDHGIERPDEREKKNKSACGHIKISISSRDNKIEIMVCDDGKGLDVKIIKSSAVKHAIISQEAADELGEKDALLLVFQSGMTTSPLITDISGRGLGLAIVKEKVEKLNGTVLVDTRLDAGTTFRMVVPLTLATFRGTLVSVARQFFVLPSANVEKVARVKKEAIKTVENRETLVFDGQPVSLVRLADILDLKAADHRQQADDALMQVVIVGLAERHIACLVDEVIGEQGVLVKPLGKQLARVRNIMGATVLGNGKVVPILNISDLLKTAVKRAPSLEAVIMEEPERSCSILVVEDSITARTLLKNILESAGYDVQTAVDGVDAITALKGREFDIVVTDVEMPRMNGFDLALKIRSDKKLSDLPIVLVTALESRADKERGIDVGANAYIVKSSFDQSNLLEVIGRLT